MADPSRVFAGFSDLSGGMDGGRAASLIDGNQAAFLSNISVRGSYASTRPSWRQLSNWDSSGVTARWNGRFQGAMFYDGEEGTSGWIVARGGNLFFTPDDTLKIQEITAKLNITTTQDFVVPALHASASVFVNSAVPFSNGENIEIDSGSYTVTNIFTDEIAVTYNGGAANATALSGTTVLDGSGNQVSEWESYPPEYDFIFMFQAENYAIILGDQHPTTIFDGRKSRFAGVNEIPPGFLGAYGWGRIWICLPDRRRFVAGNLVFDQSSGTQEHGYRDSILKFTDNNFLNTGGSFGVPANAGPITSMQFLATQDTSLGVGVLLVGTTNAVFSVNAPVDSSTWKNLTYPIQTISLIDYGPESPRATVSINGDMWHRSSDGFRSFVVARRDFGVPGNTPLSHEVIPLIQEDTPNLLFYGSAIVFDNRLLSTVSPHRTDLGVSHRGLAVVNFDLVSGLRGKLNPSWEGTWQGLDILQVVKGRIKDTERAFAFVAGTDLELWEITDSEGPDLFGAVRVPIGSVITTRSEDYTKPGMLKTLRMGEIYLDEIADTVTITIKFRPDQYPTWTTWVTLSFCATITQCTFTPSIGGQCQVWKANSKSYAARVTLPYPPESCNSLGGKPINWGHLFQFRLEITGSCRIRGFFTHANAATEPMDGECQGEVSCIVFPDCGETIYGLFDSHG